MSSGDNTMLDLDDENTPCIVQALSDDIENIRARSKKRADDPNVTDFEHSIESLSGDVRATETSLADRVMARSISNAVESDARLIEELEMERNGLLRDEEMAFRSEEGPILENTSQAHDLTPDVEDEELLTRLSEMDIAPWINEGLASSSTSRLQKDADNCGPRYKQCCACLDEFHDFDTVTAPCGHSYCRGCAAHLVEDAIEDESFFPPRCCKEPISVDAIELLVSSNLFRRFQDKAAEFSVADRTFCCQPDCSAFIPPHFVVGNTAKCPKCGAKTCIKCKAPDHEESDCSENLAEEQLKELAQENGWQTCYSCKRMIELHTGCNHITCPCKAEFCYVCGQRWKTCGCAPTNEDRLYEDGQQMIEEQDRAAYAGWQAALNHALLERERSIWTVSPTAFGEMLMVGVTIVATGGDLMGHIIIAKYVTTDFDATYSNALSAGSKPVDAVA